MLLINYIAVLFLRLAIVSKRLLSCVLAVLLCIYTPNLLAQTFSYTAETPVNLVNNILLGDGLTASNITFKNPTSHSTSTASNLYKFKVTSGNFPLDSGVFIKTGGNVLGDPDLNSLASSLNLGTVTNGGILEFDFVAQGTELSFDYMFASSEYTGYTCSSFNDVFAFFLSGPGISGPYSNGAVNLATVPNSSPPIPIVVNSINCGCVSDWSGKCTSINPNYVSDAQYWTNAYGNYGGEGFNGGTVVLTAASDLICGSTYHIKMAIANVADQGLQSGVYLKAKSFVIPPTGLINIVKDIESDKDCVHDSIEFTLIIGEDTDYDSVLWNFGDTASGIENFSTVENPKHRYTAPGTYTVSAIIYGSDSPCSLNDTLFLDVTIHDYLRDSLEVNLCYGEHYILTNGDTLFVSGTYFDTIPSMSAEECYQITTVVLTIPTQVFDITYSIDKISCYNYNDGAIHVTATGGTAPYTFKWASIQFANMPETSSTVSNLYVGTYIVTVTDSFNCTVQQVIDLVQPDKLVLTLSPDTLICPYDFANLSGKTIGGTAPISIDWGNGQTSWEITTTPTKDSVFQVVVSDQNSCTDTAKVNVKVVQLPTVAFTDDTLIGCVPMRVVLHNLSSGVWDKCLWQFTDGTSLTSCDVALHQVLEFGYQDVSLTLITKEGCTISRAVQNMIYTETVPVADFQVDKKEFTTIEDIEVSFVNTSQLSTSYVWDFGDGSAPSTQEHVWHVFPSDQGHKYVVTLTALNDIGCSSSVQKIIVVRELELFFIPNTFSPNDDPYNPYYQPVITSGIDPLAYSFTIYDRWGNPMFATTDIHQGWDGTNENGHRVQDGIYNWVLSFTPSDLSERKNLDTQVYTGKVHLIR